MNNNLLKLVEVEFNFNQHIESTISKVLKVLGFVEHSSFEFKNARSSILLHIHYIVRSILKYGLIIIYNVVSTVHTLN